MNPNPQFTETSPEIEHYELLNWRQLQASRVVATHYVGCLGPICVRVATIHCVFISLHQSASSSLCFLLRLLLSASIFIDFLLLRLHRVAWGVLLSVSARAIGFYWCWIFIFLILLTRHLNPAFATGALVVPTSLYFLLKCSIDKIRP